MIESVRLSKRVAEQLGCSRREAELYIEGGWVLVNGQCIEEPQHRVQDETVLLAPGARPEPITPATLIWHRPDAAAPCDASTLQAIPPTGDTRQRPLRRHFQQQHAAAPLQGSATGLVVFSQDRSVLRRLSDDAALLEEEFMVELPGQLTNEALTQLQAQLQQARRWPHHAVVGKISLNARGPQGTRLRVALKASCAEAIQALLAHQGLQVQSIRRTRLGRIALAGLAPGQWRFLGLGERF